MRISIGWIGLLGLGLLVVGCNSPEKILPRKDGTWEIQKESYRTSINDTLVSDYSFSNQGKMIFEKDGKGSVEYPGKITPFLWEQKEEQIQLCFDDSGGLLSCYLFDVLESEKNHQKWYSVSTEMYNYMTFKYEYEYDLIRVK